MATRTLTTYEANELGRNPKFIETVQTVAIERCIIMYNAFIATVEAGSFSTLTETEKRQWVLSSETIRHAQIREKEAFARLYAIYLYNDSVNINFPEDDGVEFFSPQRITEILIDDAILKPVHVQMNSVFDVWLNKVDITNQYFSRFPTFRQKLQNALLKTALNVAGEDTTSLNATVASKRAELATNVLTNITGYVEQFAYSVAANPALHEYSSESDIEFTVNAQWNDWAGVTYDDLNP
jgi:hypothetical protein